MSLTFEFPQWKLRVANGQAQEARSGDHVGIAAPVAGMDWAADLEDLDEDDEEGNAGDGRSAAADVGGHQAVYGQQQQQCEREGAPAAVGAVPAGSASAPGPILTDESSGTRKLGLDGGASKREGAPYSPAGVALPSGSSPASGSMLSGGAAVEKGLDEQPADTTSGTSQMTSGPRAAPVAISGDAIPAEVLLLVLSGLRDVGDCVRAALVCKHWLTVVTLSNELWYELDSIHLAGGIWQRAPHSGRPLLRPPPGCDHPHSKMMSYKTTCALTQVAVRFMALRKGFEYVVEAAASLWVAAQRAADEAGGRQRQQRQQQGAGQQSQPQTPVPELSDSAARGSNSAPDGEGANVLEVNGGGGSSSNGDGCDGSSSNGDGGSAALSEATGWAGGGGAGGGGGGGSGGGRRRRITHVDQLWESCGRSRTALQVDERFNAVRVQQMVGKLCSCSGAQWLPLYEGVAAVMASRCDQLRDQLTAAPALARASPSTSTPAPVTTLLSKRLRWGASGTPGGGGAAAAGGAGAGRSPQQQQQQLFRGEVVYGGSSYADQFAELLRRGDTRGALALGGAAQRSGAAATAAVGIGGDDASGGGGSLRLELDEPEMREVVLMAEQDAQGGLVAGNESAAAAASGGGGCGRGGEPSEQLLPPVVVAEGLLLWRQLLRGWAVYRRWLEVWAVWCGPLGARVEAERQLAGAAAAQGEAPLAPPHLTNKGLLLFRSQVLLAFPLRRPLQAAALWLSARATRGSHDDDNDGDGGGGSFGEGPGLSEEHGQLLTGIRKLLTELAIPDDATQPPHLHTRPKLQRCFGGLLLRPVPGGTRALQAAQRLQGLRAAAAAGAGGGGC